MEEIRKALDAITPPTPPSEVPPHFRGVLAQAASQSPGPIGAITSASSTQPLVSRVLFRSKDGSKGLRTNQGFLADFCSGVRDARTPQDFYGAVDGLRRVLMGTGAYKGVDAGLEATPASEGKVVGAQDLVVTLDELSYSLQAMGTTNRQGEVHTGTEAKLVNVLGQAESISFSAGRDVPMAWGVGGGDVAVGAPLPSTAAASATATPASPSPSLIPFSLSSSSWVVEARKPTLWGTPASAGLRLRNLRDPLESTSGLTSRVLEAEASLTDASNTHSLALSTAWRQLSPSRTSPTSPEALLDCTASVKNSLSYAALLGAGLKPSEALPASGSKVVTRVEVAGLGGDVGFFKVAASATWAASVARYAPDTGYTLPKTESEFKQGMSDASHPAKDLKPFPGPHAIIPWLSGGSRSSSSSSSSSVSSSSSSSGGRYTVWDRIAGWLSPGVSLVVDGTLGLVQPFSSSSSSSSSTTHLHDRFYAPPNGKNLRGFASLGPRGTLAGASGVGRGDALGGDVFGAVTARILLPPPVPSINLVNLGVRSYLWGSLGAMALSKGGGPLATLGGLTQRPSCSAGVGIVSEEGLASSQIVNESNCFSPHPLSFFLHFITPPAPAFFYQSFPVAASATVDLEYALAYPLLAKDDVPGKMIKIALCG
jgi:hypothetical protein